MEKMSEQMPSCPNCGVPIMENRFVTRKDGAVRCEHCYFMDTYLEGIAHHIDTAYLVTLEAFVSAIDAREHEVGNHSLRVTEFSLVIGNACGVRGRDLVDLYCGALLHDIGKIGVPDSVLHKAGPLTPDELTMMHKHPEIGYRIISHIGYFSRAAEIIRSHVVIKAGARDCSVQIRVHPVADAKRIAPLDTRARRRSALPRP